MVSFSASFVKLFSIICFKEYKSQLKLIDFILRITKKDYRKKELLVAPLFHKRIKIGSVSNFGFN
jgi:hypothetical protein